MARAVRGTKKTKRSKQMRRAPTSTRAVSQKKEARQRQRTTRHSVRAVSGEKQQLSSGTPSKKAVGEKPSSAVRAFEQAVKLFNRQDFERAREAFRTLIERFPRESDVIARARTYLAICDQRLQQPRPVPRTAEALYDRGVIELNRGQIAPAIVYLEKALRLDPQADHVVYALAAAYARAGQTEKALLALRQAIAMRESYRVHARWDPDFLSLYPNPEFQRLIGVEILE